MALTANSEDAQDLAAAFLEFQEPVVNAEGEIAALAAKLLTVSSALLTLRDAESNPRNAVGVDEVEEYKRIALRSLEYTFRDIHRLFGGLSNPSYRTKTEAYNGVWRDIEDHFFNESNNALVTRLDYYQRFLSDLVDMVEGYSPSRDFQDLEYKIEVLLQYQDDRLQADLAALSIGTPRVPSWERVRPLGDRLNGQVLAPDPPRRRPLPRRPPSPGFMPRRPSSPGYVPRRPPYGPEPPLSPTATTSTSSTHTSTHGSFESTHWAVTAFDQSRPTTVFKTTGTESTCVGEHMPGASNLVKKDYDEILRLPMDAMEVRIYFRETDNRARMLCKWDRSRQRLQSCYPITQLRVVRSQSCLQICRQERRSSLTLWANLRFTSYERLILFFCTFLALKAQDQANPIRRLEDYALKGEKLLFSAPIIDDTYEHALHILKDEDSTGVRLQASARGGEMKNAPIWTAFITYEVASIRWMSLYEPRKVHFTTLGRFIFSEDYEPCLGPQGQHELVFTSSRDAKDFMKMIEDVAEGRI